VGFLAKTKSGHFEPLCVKKQQQKAISEATRILREKTRREDVQLSPFELHTLRLNSLTRWALFMNPWTLA
jgi:hypothetical protein